ncbi:glutamate/gamma-aminobutyrate family transporter YjeM [Acetilactobacillus jinshanensis]|uniref:Glutamate/gamma-aminobutyrate family transporter YjeM n=1 Tax=Acetilactobacillus jinshanensis TaxID=1720083 RepID=A0A4P6ZMW6_9LACO|nr:glutamate/gamma-aminobutyrate family transporter YjeM [Acetilactobacillus jinshanensis]QBP18967.1 glutamate/gamma-aminobutyrate family transporter YjeM [Acetilactobacillus jinshanensis]URL60485.1 glutamate/gamma-aminobutyrate family transporter YjeM [uncultured bacterium]
MNNEKSEKKISWFGLVLIVISTEFGFSNIVTGYNQMSYASIIWYILTAAIFLFPLAMIFGEYSGSLKEDHGGFYSWLLNSVGEKWAFIGTFIWIGLWMINLLQNASGFGVNLSGLLFGKDTSESWTLGPFDSNEVEALMGIVIIILTTYFATKGFHKVALVSYIGGILSMAMIGIFVIASVIIWAKNGFAPKQPIHGVSSFIKSPNPQFQSPIAIISFIVYAMFAYGGMESSSGFLDKLKHPRKDYPKAMMWVAGIMSSFYVLGMLLCGFGTNWKQVMGTPGITLYNNGFIMFSYLGDAGAKALGVSPAVSAMVGRFLVRVLALGSLIPLISLLTVLIYSPVKGLIAGSSKDLWPKKVAQFNKHDMPAGAMWIECGIIVVALALVSLTGKNGQQFYQIIVDMGNVGSIVPYFFVAIAFVYFKKRTDLDRPIVFFHTMKSVYTVVAILLISMSIAVIFNVITPLMQGQISTAFWTVAGPILFAIISILMYHYGIRHRAKRMIADNEAYYANEHKGIN